MTHDVERRQMRRSVPEDHGIVQVRIKPGRDACVIDVCAGGALIETLHRLLPGVWLELHLATTERQAAIRGRVLRCAVARLRASAVWYRGAIGFDRHLPWLLERDPDGSVVPGQICGEIRQDVPCGAHASHAVIGRHQIS